MKLSRLLGVTSVALVLSLFSATKASANPTFGFPSGGGSISFFGSTEVSTPFSGNVFVTDSAASGFTVFSAETNAVGNSFGVTVIQGNLSVSNGVVSSPQSVQSSASVGPGGGRVSTSGNVVTVTSGSSGM